MPNIIVTLLWEKAGMVYRRWLVQTTGELTLPDDVPLPERVSLNYGEHLVLGARAADPEKSARRAGMNDIVVLCRFVAQSPTLVRPQKENKLVNLQSYWVLASRHVAGALAKEYLERCLALGIPLRSVYPLPSPTEWMFEVWAEDSNGGAYFNIACALLRKIAAERGVEVAFANSATDYA